MLVFAAPQRVTAARLEQAFKRTASRLRLAVHVKALAAARRYSPPPRPHLISVYGADHPGIVYRMAHLLAGLRVNITDLSTHRTTGKHPLYHLLLEVELPPRLKPRRLEQRLKTLAKRLGVGVSLRPADTALL